VLLEELSSGVVTIDQDNKITFANPATFEMLKLNGKAFDVYEQIEEKLFSSISSSPGCRTKPRS